jgi:hypothetical protein
MANIFTVAKEYQKKHPKTAWQQCIQAVKGKHSPDKVGKGKKANATAPAYLPVKKVKIKIKRTDAGSPTITIGKPKDMAADWGKERIKDYAQKSGLRLKHGYATAARLTGVHLDRVQHELQHLNSLTEARDKHKAMLKEKGLKPAEKAAIRKDILQYNKAIATSKHQVTALKKFI